MVSGIWKVEIRFLDLTTGDGRVVTTMAAKFDTTVDFGQPSSETLAREVRGEADLAGVVTEFAGD